MIEAANSNRFGVKCLRISKGLLETKGTVKIFERASACCLDQGLSYGTTLSQF